MNMSALFAFKDLNIEDAVGCAARLSQIIIQTKRETVKLNKISLGSHLILPTGAYQQCRGLFL